MFRRNIVKAFEVISTIKTIKFAILSILCYINSSRQRRRRDWCLPRCSEIFGDVKKVFMSSVFQKTAFIYSRLLLAGAVLSLAVLCGCRSDDPEQITKIDDFDYQSVINNHLNLMDFANHLYESGVPVVQVQPIREDVLRATSAMAVLIDKDEIGVYYFNTDVEHQRKIIAQYNKDGFAYILGFRFPVYMAGSYVLIGVEKHPRKKEIIKALRSFK